MAEIVPDDQRDGVPARGAHRVPVPRRRRARWRCGSSSRAARRPRGGRPAAGRASRRDARRGASPSPASPPARARSAPLRPGDAPERDRPRRRPGAAPPAAHPVARRAAGPLEPGGDARAAIDQLLDAMLARRASDLHLSSDSPPIFRVDGDMTPRAGLRTDLPRAAEGAALVHRAGEEPRGVAREEGHRLRLRDPGGPLPRQRLPRPQRASARCSAQIPIEILHRREAGRSRRRCSTSATSRRGSSS